METLRNCFPEQKETDLTANAELGRKFKSRTVKLMADERKEVRL